MGKVLDFAVPIVAAIVAPELLPALGAFAAPLGAGLATTGLGLAEGQGFGRSLEHGALSAGGSFLGSNIGNLIAPAGGALGSAASSGGGAISGAGSIGGLSGDALTGAAQSGISGAVNDALQGAANAGSLASGAGQAVGQVAGQTAGQGAGSIFGNGLGNFGTVGSNLNATFGNTIGGGINSLIGSTAANTGIGSALGGTLGSQLAQGLAGGPPSPTPPDTSFHPHQAAQSELPGSLNALSGLSPQQQASNLASQGTFGGGLGPQEESYYTNLLNRQLIDSSGNVAPLSSLSPIESTYNQQLGFGGNNNSTDLLKALSTWSP